MENSLRLCYDKNQQVSGQNVECEEGKTMRESGILMPVSSLPGPYGIGCFGKEAFKFVDFLADAGQKIWQLLPLSPTGYGAAPIRAAPLCGQPLLHRP